MYKMKNEHFALSVSRSFDEWVVNSVRVTCWFREKERMCLRWQLDVYLSVFVGVYRLAGARACAYSHHSAVNKPTTHSQWAKTKKTTGRDQMMHWCQTCGICGNQISSTIMAITFVLIKSKCNNLPIVIIRYSLTINGSNSVIVIGRYWGQTGNIRPSRNMPLMIKWTTN